MLSVIKSLRNGLFVRRTKKQKKNLFFFAAAKLSPNDQTYQMHSLVAMNATENCSLWTDHWWRRVNNNTIQYNTMSRRIVNVIAHQSAFTTTIVQTEYMRSHFTPSTRARQKAAENWPQKMLSAFRIVQNSTNEIAWPFDHRLAEINSKTAIFFFILIDKRQDSNCFTLSHSQNAWGMTTQMKSVAFTTDISIAEALLRFCKSFQCILISFLQLGPIQRGMVKWFSEPLRKSPTQIKLNIYVLMSVVVRRSKLKWTNWHSNWVAKRRKDVGIADITSAIFFFSSSSSPNVQKETKINCRMQLVTVWKSPWNSSSILMSFCALALLLSTKSLYSYYF